jgi:hypothetical protein
LKEDPMWMIDGTRTGRSRAVLGGALIAVLGALVAVSPVAGASDGPTAVTAKKKKCKGPLWRCAPKRYHLSASDTVGPGSQNPGFAESWSAEVDLVRIARSIGEVDYGAAGGTVKVSGSFATVCPDSSPATVRIEPQTIAVPPGPGYPFLGDFGVVFSLIGSDKNTYGGPLGTQGSGNSTLYATAIDPCPDGPGAYQLQLSTPRAGMEGPGKIGKVLRGSGVFNTIFEHHSFTWTLTPKK